MDKINEDKLLIKVFLILFCISLISWYGVINIQFYSERLNFINRNADYIDKGKTSNRTITYFDHGGEKSDNVAIVTISNPYYKYPPTKNVYLKVRRFITTYVFLSPPYSTFNEKLD